jgi:WhiB family redox-sensing transcriptional regulator
MAANIHLSPIPAWHVDAACAAAPNPDIFFPEPGDHESVAAAKRFCRECTVQIECGWWAMNHPDDLGIRGGMTSGQRTRARHQLTVTLPLQRTPAA